MYSKFLLQHAITEDSDYDCPELLDFISQQDIPITLPIPLSLEICQDFVSFFQELENNNLYTFYYNFIKNSTNIYVFEFIRIIKHILKLQDMLTQMYDVCVLLFYQNDENRNAKTTTSLYDCSQFLNKYSQSCQLSSRIYRDHICFSNNSGEETMFFLEILSECFQDIYALDYILNQSRYNCFRNYTEIIYEDRLDSINDEETWEVMMICDEEPVLMSHIYLPHPDDFRLLIQA